MQTSVAKKIFAVGVAASTVLMSLAPFAAQAAAHVNGTNIKTSDGTVSMIIDGQRRPYTSAGAFLSYGFNSWSQVVDANADDLALPVGSFIPPQDGKIICSDRGADKGTCYLITGGQKAGFTSAAVFTGLGFSFARSQSGDVSWMTSTTNIDNTTAAHRPGVLVNNNGTVFLVGTTGLLGIPDVATFNSWGYSFSDVVMANAADKAMTQTGVMASRTPGQLSPTALTPTTPTTPTTVNGSVVVSAASGQTPASNVPLSATNVNFVKFNVANGSGSAVTINQVTVKRMGAGATSNISNVYLYQGASRLTSGRSINSSTNEAVFSGLNVTVPAYGSITLDVLADIAGSGTGNTHQMSVTSVVMGTTMASGSATGNMMTLAGVSSGTLTIAKTGTIANPKVGEKGVRVAAFTLNANSSEDQVVKRISLYQAGATSRGNLVNLVLKQAGTTLATASALDSKDKVNFEVNYALAKGDTKTFEVYADIAGGARTGSSETVKFYVEEASDLFAVGQTYGFGTSVTRTTYDGDSCTSTSGDCSYSYIEGGQLTITFNGPVSKDIAKNSKDVELFNFTMAAQNNLEVRQMQFTFNNGGSGTADLQTGGATPNYTDIKIVDATTGAVVWGPQDLSGTGNDTTQTLTFTEDVVLAAGSSKTYKVTADVSNESDVSDSDKLGATLVVSALTSNQVKNLDNNLFLTAADIVPTASVAGNQMTLKTTGLTIALAATPVSKTVVKGTNGVEVAGYAFTASTAKDVKVTDITLTGIIEDNGDTTMVAGYESDTNVSDDVVTVELYDGATKIGQTKSPAVTTGLTSFTGLNWVIPAGTTKTLTVKMNINSTATTNDDIKFGIASSNVTAVDNDGNSVSVSGLPSNMTLLTTAGTVITITGSGSMTVGSAGTSATDSTDARIVVAGQEVTMGKINFTANNEELQINKLRLTLESATGTIASVTDDVMSVSLYNAAGTKIAGPVSITPTNDYEGYADINSITGLIVPKDETVTVTVKAQLNTISGGADSGDEFALAVDTSNNFEARGTAGSTYLTTIATGSYTSQYMVLRKGQPKFELQTLPSTTISNGGTNTLMKFKVTADGAPVALKYLEFNVSTTTGVTVATPAISEVGGSDIAVSADTAYGANGAVVRMMLSSEETITTSKTYEFKMVVSGADTGDSVTTTFATQDTAAVTGDLNGTTFAIAIDDVDDGTGTIGVVGDGVAQDAAYNLLWSDKSVTGHNDSDNGTDDWTNGRYVKTLTGSQGLSK